MKLEPTGFAHRLDKGYEKKRGVKENYRFFGPSNLKEGVVISWDGETVRKAGLGGRSRV